MRQLGDYKDSVTTKSAPEGCIAEAYIAWGYVTYTKFYLGAVDPPQPMSVVAVQYNLSTIINEVEVQERLHDSCLQPYKMTHIQSDDHPMWSHKDQRRRYQNSGVMIDGGYYDILLEVVELIHGGALTV
ncbi:hypothetical protein OROGR_024414 [Orobanche gracilis]